MAIDWDFLPVDVTNYLLSKVIDIFFRDIEARGAHYIPQEGPVFFVGAPHANQFLDPIVLNRHSGRRIHYLIAKKSYDSKTVGGLARLTGSIPVSRAQDYTKLGSGTVKLIEKYNNPLTLHGVDTKFISQLNPGDQIALSEFKVSMEVVEIISDTELIVKKEVTDEKALKALLGGEGVKFKCVPHLDHSVVYQAVHETLNQGGCVGIFPEGGSHDRTQLLPLKAGIAIMSLGAMAENPDLDVKIVPCGLNYFHPDRFRSRAVVQYGKPITISKEMVEQFKKGGLQKRQAGTQLLSEISDALKNVTINCPDYETLKIVQAARRLYRPPNTRLKIGQVVQLNRKLVEGYLHFKDDPKIIDVREEIMEYNKALSTFGIRDHQVNKSNMNRLRATFRFIRRVTSLAIFSTLALPGAILNAPIFITANAVSKKKQKEALAASTVKIKARDVISSWKMLIALGLGPALYLVYAMIAYFTAGSYGLPFFSRAFYAFGTFVAVPTISYMSLLFGERGLDIYKSLRPLFLNMIGSTAVKELQATREDLSNKITELVNTLGPQLFPDLDRIRIVDESQPRSGALTPTTQSALNWFMSPFEGMSERLFSDTDYSDSSAAPSRSSSHPNLSSLFQSQSLSKLSLSEPKPLAQPNSNINSDKPTIDLQGISNFSPINQHDELDDSMIVIQPPSPILEEPKKDK